MKKDKENSRTITGVVSDVIHKHGEKKGMDGFVHQKQGSEFKLLKNEID